MKGHLRAALGRDLPSAASLAPLMAGLLAAALAALLYKLGPPQHQLKAGLGLIAIGVIAAAALRPVFALGFVVALMPFEYKVSGLGTDEVLILGAAAILIWRIEARRVPWWVALSSFALVMGSFLTVIGAHDPSSALWGAVRWLGALVLLAAAFSVLHGRTDVNRRLMDIIVGSAVVVVGFALLQRSGVYVIVSAPYQAGQISSTFGYYTVYGGFVGMAAVLATGEILYSLTSGQRSRAIRFGVGLTIILIGVAISLSRGALLCVGAGWVVLLILNARRASLVVKGIALVLVFVAAGYAATPPHTRTAFVNRFSTPVGSQAEDRERFALQAAGRTALAHHPDGLGYGNFSYYLASHPVAQANATFFHSHQMLTQIGLDAGWLGLAGFIALLAGALIVAVRAAPLPGGVRNTAFAAAMCGLLAQGLYDYLFYEISMLALWVVLIFGAAQMPVRGRSPNTA
jgi:hypothetical protein